MMLAAAHFFVIAGEALWAPLGACPRAAMDFRHGSRLPNASWTGWYGWSF